MIVPIGFGSFCPHFLKAVVSHRDDIVSAYVRAAVVMRDRQVLQRSQPD
jgi:hypothetical protein